MLVLFYVISDACCALVFENHVAVLFPCRAADSGVAEPDGDMFAVGEGMWLQGGSKHVQTVDS